MTYITRQLNTDWDIVSDVSAVCRVSLARASYYRFTHRSENPLGQDWIFMWIDKFHSLQSSQASLKPEVKFAPCWSEQGGYILANS